jgi:plastocyanin
MENTNVLLKKKNFFLLSMFFLFILVNSCSKSNNSVTSSNKGNTGGVTQQNTVTIQGFAFSPATLTVPVNTTVTWTNKDGTTHTVTSDTGAFDSGSIAANQSYSFKFSSTGTYSYHCSIHPEMKGQIVVQ